MNIVARINISSNLKKSIYEIGYYSYTHRCSTLDQDNEKSNYHFYGNNGSLGLYNHQRNIGLMTGAYKTGVNDEVETPVRTSSDDAKGRIYHWMTQRQ